MVSQLANAVSSYLPMAGSGLLTVSAGALSMGVGVRVLSSSKGISQTISGIVLIGGGVFAMGAGLKSMLEGSSSFECPELLPCGSGDKVSDFNYHCFSGYHTAKSVVVGTRWKELAEVQNKAESEPLLQVFEKALYHTPEIRDLIPRSCRSITDKAADLLFSTYIDKYRHCGINEDNIVVLKDQFMGGIAVGANNRGFDRTSGVSIITVIVAPTKDQYWNQPNSSPAGVVKLHEVMHLEETDSFTDKARINRPGLELITTVKSVILADELYKQCKKISIGDEVDYSKNLEITASPSEKLSLPIGRIANCYRALEEKFGALYKGIISPESIQFLKTGVCPQ